MTGKPERPHGSGVKTVRRVLADGTVKTYRYKLRAHRPRPEDGILRTIFNEYSASPDFKRLAPAWQSRKLWLFRLIESELGWLRLEDLEDRRARAQFFALRDLYADLPHRADKMMQSLSSALSWAYDRAMISVNHAARIPAFINPKLSPHRDKYYSPEQEELILAKAPADLRQAYLMALYTGLRRGDLIRLEWADLKKDGWLIVRPSKTARKTGIQVQLPANYFPPLRDLLAELPRLPDRPMLTTETGKAWSEFNISHRWRRLLIKLEIPAMRFHDIRGTTATRLVEAGCTEAERASILGHAASPGSGASYIARTRTLGLNAYARWWKQMNDPVEIIDLGKMAEKMGRSRVIRA